jgi:hypothetical protein
MPSEICSVFIELLPEFGWSIDNKAVYGPGSILQGIFCVYIFGIQ